jgi:unsaturated chondroitin disaccharide hydrolase
MRLDPDARKRAEYRVALITAANSLSRRSNSRIGALQSGTYNGRWGLIVDSAMNAPLLIEAGQMLGGRMSRALQRRGTRHMQTLAANLVRADGSTFHRMTFNPRTGARIGPVFGQGLSTASTWARGQAWAMHGFADAFTLTRNPAFLQVAESTADYWMRHVEPGCVPAWDLQVEVSRAPRDSSAAAIAAEALLTLAAAEPDSTRAATYRAAGLATRAALTDPTWVPAATGRGLLQHQSYNVPAVPAEGSYAWGDFYLLSVLAKSG